MDFSSRRLLNVADDASNEQISKAARPYLNKYHPDKI